MPETFHSSFGIRLTVAEVIRDVVTYMRAEPKRRYKITVGTDSEQLANKSADFVTAIVVHRVGNGGRYFFRRGTIGTFHTLRDRIMKEVFLSLDAGKLVLEELANALREGGFGDAFPQWDFEIHIDVGEQGPTKAMLQEVVGIVRANNFAAITKPGSYAASSVADRHV